MAARIIIAIGAASGGIEPLRRITEDLPRNCGATIFVVLHSGAAGLLPEILSWRGKLPVEFARDGVAIKSGRIYVAPPDFHMLVGSGRFQLTQSPKLHSVRPAIDLTFASVAREYGDRALGIVLSDTGTDGAVGLLEIEKHGGRTLVQEPRAAAQPAMPEAAIAAASPESLSVEDIRDLVSEFCSRNLSAA
jgi:two-component system chemotaxis response regulator CheB